MKTTTQLPVLDFGAVVEVALTCSYPEAVKKGSSRITCKSYTDYTYDEELSCELPGTFDPEFF